jgi:DNA-binding XRE family transcriptional regulator
MKIEELIEFMEEERSKTFTHLKSSPPTFKPKFLKQYEYESEILEILKSFKVIEDGIDKEKRGAIPANIKRVRKQKGLTQVELAQASKVSLAWIRNIEQGFTGFSMNTLSKIIGVLGLSILEENPRIEVEE